MKMKKGRFFVAFIVFLLLPARGRIFAWGSTWMGAALEQIVDSAHWRLGALKYNAAIRVDDAGHDSDIYFGSLANPVPDYTFSAGPDIQVFLPLKKRIVFDISESPRYVFFLHTDRERTFNNTFTGQVHFIFDRFYIQVGGELINAKQRLSTELNLNIRLKEDDMNGLMLWQVSKGASLALQYRRSTLNYENLTSGFVNVSEALDRTETHVDAMAYLQQHSRVRFYLDGQYGSYVFAESVSRFKDSRSYGISGGAEFLPPAAGYEGQTSGIRGSINIGYQSFNVLDPLQKDYSGLSGNTAVSIGIMKLTALRAFFFRGPQFSVYSSQTYYLQTFYGAGLVRSLARHVLFAYDFYYGRDDYSGGGISGGSPSGGPADRYQTHSFMLNFRLRRELELSLLARLGKRNSTLAPRPESRDNFFGLSLTYGYSSAGLSMPASPMFR